jgi:hypothetical protein
VRADRCPASESRGCEGQGVTELLAARREGAAKEVVEARAFEGRRAGERLHAHDGGLDLGRRAEGALGDVKELLHAKAGLQRDGKTAVCRSGGKVTREAGPVKGGTSVIAFVEDPDGYKIEFIDIKRA